MASLSFSSKSALGVDLKLSGSAQWSAFSSWRVERAPKKSRPRLVAVSTIVVTFGGRVGGGAGVANVKATCGGCFPGLMAWMAVRMASASGMVASGSCGLVTPQNKKTCVILFFFLAQERRK